MNMVYQKSFKNKKTGDIVTVCSTSSGCGGERIKVAGKDGRPVEMEMRKFFKEYEFIDVDITPVLPNLKSYFDVCPQAKRMVFSLLRRIHPGGYFNRGDLVYILYEGASIVFGGNIDKYSFITNIGPGEPYIITEIDKDYVIIHKHLPGTPIESYSGLPGEIRLPIDERLEKEDAYACLARYDVAY